MCLCYGRDACLPRQPFQEALVWSQGQGRSSEPHAFPGGLFTWLSEAGSPSGSAGEPAVTCAEGLLTLGSD